MLLDTYIHSGRTLIVLAGSDAGRKTPTRFYCQSANVLSCEGRRTRSLGCRVSTWDGMTILPVSGWFCDDRWRRTVVLCYRYLWGRRVLGPLVGDTLRITDVGSQNGLMRVCSRSSFTCQPTLSMLPVKHILSKPEDTYASKPDPVQSFGLVGGEAMCQLDSNYHHPRMCSSLPQCSREC